MQSTLVMTIIGPDRPGLVERLAALVADHGGNWLESRMAHLGGQFAGILRIQLPGEQQERLLRALGQIENQGLSLTAHPDAVPAVPAERPRARLEIVGQDRPGIVRQIAAVLAGRGINVEELHTQCESAAMSGETLFRARADLAIPPGCDLPGLRRELEQIAGDLMVECNLALPSQE